jgi:hypothetical protein
VKLSQVLHGSCLQKRIRRVLKEISESVIESPGLSRALRSMLVRPLINHCCFFVILEVSVTIFLVYRICCYDGLLRCCLQVSTAMRIRPDDKRDCAAFPEYEGT